MKNRFLVVVHHHQKKRKISSLAISSSNANFMNQNTPVTEKAPDIIQTSSGRKSQSLTYPCLIKAYPCLKQQRISNKESDLEIQENSLDRRKNSLTTSSQAKMNKCSSLECLDSCTRETEKELENIDWPNTAKGNDLVYDVNYDEVARLPLNDESNELSKGNNCQELATLIDISTPVSDYLPLSQISIGQKHNTDVLVNNSSIQEPQNSTIQARSSDELASKPAKSIQSYFEFQTVSEAFQLTFPELSPFKLYANISNELRNLQKEEEEKRAALKVIDKLIDHHQKILNELLTKKVKLQTEEDHLISRRSNLTCALSECITNDSFIKDATLNNYGKTLHPIDPRPKVNNSSILNNALFEVVSQVPNASIIQTLSPFDNLEPLVNNYTEMDSNDKIQEKCSIEKENSAMTSCDSPSKEPKDKQNYSVDDDNVEIINSNDKIQTENIFIQDENIAITFCDSPLEESKDKQNYYKDDDVEVIPVEPKVVEIPLIDLEDPEYSAKESRSSNLEKQSKNASTSEVKVSAALNNVILEVVSDVPSAALKQTQSPCDNFETHVKNNAEINSNNEMPEKEHSIESRVIAIPSCDAPLEEPKDKQNYSADEVIQIIPEVLMTVEIPQTDLENPESPALLGSLKESSGSSILKKQSKNLSTPEVEVSAILDNVVLEVVRQVSSAALMEMQGLSEDLEPHVKNNAEINSNDKMPEGEHSIENDDIQIIPVEPRNVEIPLIDLENPESPAGVSENNYFFRTGLYQRFGQAPKVNGSNNVFARSSFGKQSFEFSTLAFGGKTNSFVADNFSRDGYGAFQQSFQKSGYFGTAPSFEKSSGFENAPAFRGPLSFSSGNALSSVPGSSSESTFVSSVQSPPNSRKFSFLASQPQRFGSPQFQGFNSQPLLGGRSAFESQAPGFESSR